MMRSNLDILKKFVLSLLLWLFVFAPAAFAADAADRDWHGFGNQVDLWLTVLHNNDGESQLINAGSGREDFGGVARFTTLVRQLRRDARRRNAADQEFWWWWWFFNRPTRTSVTLSSGDNFLAGPEFNASLDNGVPFYDTIGLDFIRYDALAIGNHEFDFGPDTLADFIGGHQRRVRYLSANLDFSNEPRLQDLVDDRIIRKSMVLRKSGHRIGVIGATTEALASISSPRDVIINEVAPAVQAEIDKLSDWHVNKIILISHLQDVDGDIALAQELDGLDVMIAGGGDELLANDDDLLIPGDVPQGPYPIIAMGADGAEIPVVTTSGNYQYVGRLVVGFNRRGKVIRINDSSGPVRVAGGDNDDAVNPNFAVQRLVTDPVQEYVDDLDANVIGMSEVGLDGIRANIRSIETNLGNLVADATLWAANEEAPFFGLEDADAAFFNGGGIRNDDIRGPGEITELDTFDIVPFANFITIVPDIPRDQFKELMENAVSRLDPPSEPGGTGRFAQIAGFSMEYDINGTPQSVDDDGNVLVPGTRIVTITLDDGTSIVAGGVVNAGDSLNVATAAFLARGGDQYPFRGAAFDSVGVTDQQSLRNYIGQALAGQITAADYPEGGEGRVVRLP